MFSGSILSTLEESESDFLLLFDCCNAYHPPSRPSGSGRNVIEVISAVGFGAIAAEPGTDSFTHHLDEALALAKRSGPIKVVRLHTEIIARLFPNTPRRLRQGSSFVVDENGPVEERSRRMCPLHYWLSGQSRSITLAPLSQPLQTVEKPLWKEAPPSVMPAPNDLTRDGVIQIQQATFPQVLVCFRVTREDLDPVTWVKWLREAPPEARDLIKIEGFWGSFSSLMLVRMPVHVWDLLPASRAVSFMGFTTTDNEGPRFQEEVEALLSPAGKKAINTDTLPLLSLEVLEPAYPSPSSPPTTSWPPPYAFNEWNLPIIPPLLPLVDFGRLHRRGFEKPGDDFRGILAPYRARRSAYRQHSADHESAVIRTKRGIKIGDSDQIWDFYNQRFKNVQQNLCKLLAKIWIKVLAPKGGAVALGRVASTGDERAPDWWPKPWGTSKDERVRYVATDHMLKKGLPSPIPFALIILSHSRTGLPEK